MKSLVPDSAKYDLIRQLQCCQSKSRRNGKVARLPATLREQINRMLDDGLEYKTIIKNLGPAGQHLNEDNLTSWRKGGYQDYLRAQIISDRAQVQTQAAADVLRETGRLDPDKLRRACGEIALLQYMETLLEHGEQIARKSLKKNPAKFITLMNACCNLSNSNIAIEKSQVGTLLRSPARTRLNVLPQFAFRRRATSRPKSPN
jgi:predicted metal-dependent peptidase